MSDELYNIVFKGELVRSFDLPAVKKNIGQLFKMDGSKLEALFSGKTIVLKRNLNFETATKYRVAIKKAGARVDLVMVESEPMASSNGSESRAPAGTTKPLSQLQSGSKPESKTGSKPQPKDKAGLQAQSKTNLGKAAFGERTAAVSPDTALSGSPSEDSRAEEVKGRGQADMAGFSLAPAGSDVLSESERKEHVDVEIDTSALSVKAAGGDLLESGEKRQFDVLEVDFGGIDVAPPGESLLRDEEKKKAEILTVDTSALSIADPGVRLGKPAPPPPPAPDVSNIHLEP